MSENINQSENTEIEMPVSETGTVVESAVVVKNDTIPDTSTKEKHGYNNKTARLLNNFAFAGVLLAIVSLGFQCYLSISSYLQQMAPIGIAALYTVVSLLTPLFAMLAACGMFKFFAEVVEQLDKNGKN